MLGGVRLVRVWESGGPSVRCIRWIVKKKTGICIMYFIQKLELYSESVL